MKHRNIEQIIGIGTALISLTLIARDCFQNRIMKDTYNKNAKYPAYDYPNLDYTIYKNEVYEK